MSPKYPTLPFCIEDVRQMLMEAETYASGTTITLRLAPTKHDAGRIVLIATGFRRAVRLGEKPRLQELAYVRSGPPASLDREVHSLLWRYWQNTHEVCEGEGGYTELIPGFRPR